MNLKRKNFSVYFNFNFNFCSKIKATIEVSFKFTENYPDEVPEIIIEESENLYDEEEFLQSLKTTAVENIGSPMIYTILCALTEKLNKDNEDRKTNEANEKERLERKREEEELVIFFKYNIYTR